MKIGIDLDDVTAVCAVPYLRRFADHFGVELPDEQEIGWHLLDREDVAAEERDRFRIALYDSTFFSELEPYPDCPVVLERLVQAGHELYFITARTERRRVVTETWLREKDLMRHARAVYLKPTSEIGRIPGRYDAESSAVYKTRVAQGLGLEAFCEDDVTIARSLAQGGIRVYLFDRAWNRGLEHPNISRIPDWEAVAREIGV